LFKDRTYRTKAKKKGLVSFNITAKETNLYIQADLDLSKEAIKSVLESRGYIESYIAHHPEFLTSMTPLNINHPAPPIILDMINASKKANVGPMAAVAGAIAEYTGNSLLKKSKQVIVENGGDIFMKIHNKTVFSIFAGSSPLNMKIGVRVTKKDIPFALCTSSGTIGHSKSFGKADAVTIVSNSCALADATATLLGNIVKKESDIKNALHLGKNISDIQGIIIIKKKKIGLWGDLELVKLPPKL